MLFLDSFVHSSLAHAHSPRIWTQFRFAVTRVRRYKRQERVVCVMFWSRPCCRCRSKLLLFAEASAFRLGSFLKKCQILNERIHCLVVDNTRSQLTHMENAFVVFHSSFHSCECDSQYQLQTSFNFFASHCKCRLHTYAYYSRLASERENRSLCIHMWVFYFLVKCRGDECDVIRKFIRCSSSISLSLHRTKSRKLGCINISISFGHTRSTCIWTKRCCASVARLHNTYTHTLAHRHMPFGSRNSARATHVPVPLSSFAIRVMLAVAWLVEKALRAYFFPRHCESIAMPMVNALDTERREEKKRKLPEKRQQQRKKMGMQKIYD